MRIYRGIIGRAQGGPVAYLASNGRKPSTTAHQGVVLSCYYRWAIEQGYIAKNPMAGLRFRAPQPQPVKPFTLQELRAMLANCRTLEEYVTLILLVDTGLRASEITRLRPQDLSLEDHTLYVLGKGSKRRYVGVCEATGYALTQAFKAAAMPRTRWRVANLVKRVAKRAGVSGARPHRFRHSLCHHLLVAGANLNDVRLILGHSTFRMVSFYGSFHEVERALAAHRQFSLVARLSP